jgi:hypothetical protein
MRLTNQIQKNYYNMKTNITDQRLQELIAIAPTVAVRMDMEWLSSTSNTADFQIRLTSTGTSIVKLNAFIIRGVHSPKITSGIITWKALNDNADPKWLGWPQKGTTNLPYISGARKLNFSSATNIFTNETAPIIPNGNGVVVGTFRVFTTTTWNPNTDFGFVWEMTTGGVVGYINFETQSTTSLLPVGFMHYGPTTSNTIGKCLTVTSPITQVLNR